MEPITDERLKELLSELPSAGFVGDLSDIAAALRELLALREQMRWQAVTNDHDSLPEPGWWGNVVYEIPGDETRYRALGSYSYHGGWSIDGETPDARVTHWADPPPLPAPPLEG